MFVIIWIIGGIESIGKINPDKIVDGKSETNVAIENATCCEFAITEIKIPIEVDANRNKRVEIINNV